MKRLYLYDDAKARAFEPFALTRPVSELRAGAELIRLRWERVAGTRAYGFIGAGHLSDFEEPGTPPSVYGESTIPAGSVIVNSRFAVSLAGRLDDSSAAFSAHGAVCAVRLARSIDMKPLADGTIELGDLAQDGTAATPIAGRWLNEVWDLVATLQAQLNEDIPLMGAGLAGGAVENATVTGKHRVYCEIGAQIEPYVVLDTSQGPILIRRGTTIGSFTTISGPTYVGEDTHVVGDLIRGCSIGSDCKVRGEMSATIVLGDSNKGHTGFVGHSYIGRWVNLGAGTTTSNLKNTYGPIDLWTPEGFRETGLQFFGSLIGDHAKLGIGSMLTTGCVIGAGANIFGAHLMPKHVPPFAWGEHEPWTRNEFDKFCEVTERMMERRNCTLGGKTRAQLAEAYRMSGDPA